MEKPIELMLYLRPRTATVEWKDGTKTPVDHTVVKTHFASLKEVTEFLSQNEEQVIRFEIKGENEHLEKPILIEEQEETSTYDNVVETQDYGNTENELDGIEVDIDDDEPEPPADEEEYHTTQHSEGD